MPPKTIWLLWFQGWNKAPELVRACGESWKQHNPGWKINYLSNESIKAYLDQTGELGSILQKHPPMEALSDLIRAKLLDLYGGIWVDSTVYCLRPLDDWVYEASPSGFFAFDRPGKDRMLSTWFLVAEPNCHIVRVWREKAYAYWADRVERDHYFWFHYLFEDAYKSDERFRDIWDRAPKISADGPHAFIPHDEHLLGGLTDFHRAVVETAQTPMLKLTHKVAHNEAHVGTTYRWLCDRMRRTGSDQRPF